MMIEVFGNQDEVKSLNLTFKDVTNLPGNISGMQKDGVQLIMISKFDQTKTHSQLIPRNIF
jgi:hypothetical protein